MSSAMRSAYTAVPQCTDGLYYWRRDTAAYVDHYRVGLPDEFVEHMRQLQWICPTLEPGLVLEIDRLLLTAFPPSTKLKSFEAP
jgi:hypothetical protein